jgi:hypothetical protein
LGVCDIGYTSGIPKFYAELICLVAKQLNLH